MEDGPTHASRAGGPRTRTRTRTPSIPPPPLSSHYAPARACVGRYAWFCQANQREGLRRPTLKQDGLSMRASEPASAVDPDAVEHVSHLSESRTTAGGDQSWTLRSPVQTHPELHGFARAHGPGRTARGQQGPPARACSTQSRKMRGPVTDRRSGPRGNLIRNQDLVLPAPLTVGPPGRTTLTGSQRISS